MKNLLKYNKNDDYAKGNLLDYLYHQNLLETGLSRPKNYEYSSRN